jgi:hypothetical protein
VVGNFSEHPAVNEHFTPVDGPYNLKKTTHEKIVLMHFVLKSKAEYEQKIARRSPTRIRGNWDFFKRYDAAANETHNEGVWISEVCNMRHIVKRQHAMFAEAMRCWKTAQTENDK